MSLNRKISLITISLLALSLLISSTITIVNFKAQYTDALLTGTFGIGQSIETQIHEMLFQGQSLENLSNMDRKLGDVVRNNPHIAYAAIVDSQGRALYHSQQVHKGRLFDDPATQRTLVERKPISQLYQRLDGRRYYDVAIPLLEGESHYLGFIRLGFLASVVSDKVNRAITRMLINVTLTFFIVAMLINLILHRSIIEPMKRLSNYAGAIAKGRFERLEPIGNRDEIGQLANSLQQMGATLQTQIEDLKNAGQELEDQITIRTRELADTNRVLATSNEEIKDALKRERSLTEALRLSEERFRMLFEKNKAVMLIINPKNGRIIEANRAAVNYYGYPRYRLLDMLISDINTLKPAEVAREMRLAELEERSYFHFQHTLASGDVRDVEVHSGPLNWAGRSVLYSIIHDITDRKRAEAELERIAHYDALTGLPNRLLKSDRLRQAIIQSKRTNTLVAVCYLDLDGFKPINDLHGHEIGDQVLVETAQRLMATVRGGDTVSRIGGDEFVLILTELENLTAIEVILKRILNNTAVPIQVHGHEVSVSASIGFTVYPADDSDADLLLRHADQAMYVAKDLGKNCYHLFDPEQDRQVKAHRESYLRLIQALSDEEFVLYYQPKVNMYSGRVIGAEALIRWEHPEEGILLPGDFLHNLSETELEIDLGIWVIRQAMAQLDEWRKEAYKFSLSVNISPHHLQHPDFLDQMRAALEEYPQVSPQKLELEILETSSIEDLSRTVKTLVECQNLGIQVVLDDFGTGYSSLTYFHRLPVDILKIDQSFVSDMLEDPQDLAIVDSVLRLAQAFHHPVIAEGVESLEHGAALLRLGCQLGQGFGIGYPMPVELLANWLESWKTNEEWQGLKQRLESSNRSDIEAAINSHQQWVMRAVDNVRNPEKSSQIVLVDSHNCSFGRWFYGAGYFQYGHMPEYGTIRESHERIHLLGQELHNLVIDGHRESAMQRLEELQSMHEDFVGNLEVLITTVH
ncbi:MAG: EAL domain-containing protein [Candidatus Thiodiazotropha sp.]